MNKLDVDFLEAYKKLDNLCKDMLRTDKGVTSYIDQMETNRFGFYKVSTWNSDLKDLKHIRWIRNQLSHDIDCDGLTQESDLEYTMDFYSRIMAQEDPFSKFRKIEQEQEVKRAQAIRDAKIRKEKLQNNNMLETDDKEQKSFFARMGVYLGIAIILIIIFLVFK